MIFLQETGQREQRRRVFGEAGDVFFQQDQCFIQPARAGVDADQPLDEVRVAGVERGGFQVNGEGGGVVIFQLQAACFVVKRKGPGALPGGRHGSGGWDGRSCGRKLASGHDRGPCDSLGGVRVGLW